MAESKLYIWNGKWIETNDELVLVRWIAEITRTSLAELANVKLVEEESVVTISESGEVFRVNKTLCEEKQHITPCEIYGSTNMGTKLFVINWCSWIAAWQFFDFQRAEVTWNSNRGVAQGYIYELDKKAEELRTFCKKNAGKKWKVKFL